MKSRKLGIALLVMLAFVVTTGTFAYWATSITGPDNDTTVGTVTVGTGSEVTTSFTLTNNNASGGQLVPAGLAGAGEVESVVLSYSVQWLEDADATTSTLNTTTTGTLTVTPVVTVKNAGGTDVTATVGSLITVTPGSNATSLTLGAAASTLTYTVTMSEPTTQAAYAAIAGGEITVTFTWAVSSVATN